jgi:pimeloyl-ACP methyl ester carboxylesterase
LLLFAISTCFLCAQESTISYTRISNLKIAYTKIGKGPAIILLHGFTQDSRVWKSQVASLSEKFTVIAWDAPGTGMSDDPVEPFTITDWADCLASLLDSAGIDKAHILGLSWGGLLAQEFYRRYSDRVLSLILCDTSVGWTGALSDSIANVRLAACIRDSSLPPAELVLNYLPGMFSDSVPDSIRKELAGIIDDTHPAGFRLMATAVAIADTRAVLPTIKVPTLLIWGNEDKRSPLNAAYKIRDAIHGAKLEIISGAGHVSNMEKPDQFNKAVKEFCLSFTSLK